MAVKTSLYPDLKISIADQRPSGYFREDTLGSANPIQKFVADAFYIPSVGEGIRYVKHEGNERKILPRGEAFKLIEEKSEGYEDIIAEPYPIRYIAGCPEIDMEWQDEHNWKPRPDPKSDEICIEFGFGEFVYSHNPAKYRYLKEVMYNKDLPNRFAHRSPLFFEVKEVAKVMVDIDAELAVNEAMNEWAKLVTKQKGGKSLLNELKINGYAALLNVQGANVSERLKGLLDKLKRDPKGFVEKVRAYEETTITEITHAMQLELIRYEGNVAIFAFGTNKRVELGTIGAKQSKIERLGELLKTAEYKELYVMLKTQIELAKEKQLN